MDLVTLYFRARKQNKFDQYMLFVDIKASQVVLRLILGLQWD